MLKKKYFLILLCVLFCLLFYPAQARQDITVNVKRLYAHKITNHLNFWNQGYRGLMITNFFVSPNPHYHEPEDTIDLLDFEKIAKIVRGLYRALIKL